MIEYHFEIQKLLSDGWVKYKSTAYHIFLDKDGKRRKMSLNSGQVLSETEIGTVEKHNGKGRPKKQKQESGEKICQES